MAVFGAPRELAAKERAAVLAGREIVAAVRSVGGTDADRVSAGVGVATGTAFVGNIQSADRVIWAVLGDTTNLAARLEALTRDLDVAMVINAATHRGAGDQARDFELRADIPIRGRAQREDLYVLPATGSIAGDDPRLGRDAPA